MNDIQVLVFNKHSVGHIARVPRFPLPGETIKATKWEYGQDAAKGTNVAVVLGRLGVPTAFIEKVGNDGGGQFGRDWLVSAGVDISAYEMRDDIVTDVGLVIIREDGENMIIGSAPHPCWFSEEDVRRAIDSFPDAKYFVSGLEINHDMALYACKYAKSAGKTVLLNASPLVKAIDDLSFVDYLFVNEVEAAELAGGAKIVQREFPRLLTERLGCAKVVMTLGGEGCVLYDSGKKCAPDEAGGSTLAIPGYKVPVVDTVGAGDGFMAAFAAALTWGKNDTEACRFATRYGAAVVQLPGSITTYPGLEDMEKLMEGIGV